jgi:hypothetical protein
VRKQALFQARDEHDIELQAFAGVHRHKLHRVLPLTGLVITRLQCGMGEEGRQRGHDLAALFIRHSARCSVGGLGLAAKAFNAHEALRGGYQFFQVLDAISPLAFQLVVLHQAAVLQHQLDDFTQG